MDAYPALAGSCIRLTGSREIAGRVTVRAVTDRPGLRRIVYGDGFDELAAIEASWRGYLGSVQAELDDGTRYTLTFYDHVRLGQSLEYEVSRGRPFYTDPGLIVLSEVTVENVETAVQTLCAEGYFEYLRPVAGD
jgi:hypothetical protein